MTLRTKAVGVGIMALLFAGQGCGSDGSSNTSATTDDPGATAVDLPKGDLVGIGVGQETLLVVQQVGRALEVVPITTDGTTVRAGSPVELSRRSPLVEEVSAVELPSGGWVVGARVCTDPDDSDEGCHRTTTHIERTASDGSSPKSVGDYDLGSYSMLGELPDHRVLVVSVGSGRDASRRYSELDLNNGALTEFDWQPEQVSESEVRGSTACVTKNDMFVLGRATPGSVTVIAAADGKVSASVKLNVRGAPVQILCNSDGDVTVVSIDQDTLRAYPVTDAGQVGNEVPQTLDGQLVNATYGPGTVAVTVGPSMTPEAIRERTEARVNTGTDPSAGEQVIAFVAGSWTRSNVTAHRGERVALTGDGQLYVGISGNSVRTWMR